MFQQPIGPTLLRLFFCFFLFVFFKIRPNVPTAHWSHITKTIFFFLGPMVPQPNVPTAHQLAVLAVGPLGLKKKKKS